MLNVLLNITNGLVLKKKKADEIVDAVLLKAIYCSFSFSSIGVVTIVHFPSSLSKTCSI